MNLNEPSGFLMVLVSRKASPVDSSGSVVNFISGSRELMCSMNWALLDFSNERGVKEAIQINIHKPTLNRDQGRYHLPPIWHNIIKTHLTTPVGGGTTETTS